MSCRNWECGVVVPINAPNQLGTTSASTATAASGSKQSEISAATRTTSASTAAGVSDLEAVFASTLPVPMMVPGRPYGPNEEPWFFAGSR
jgi:hypothetical protein